ncbi:MAG TPA: class I SAM-dependent methyltransferase [archaeon]|nr:class I SAM-dependent methyltransferase [archaeon]
MPKPNDKNIKEVYNKIAEGFYHLRQQPITPEIKKLAEEWKPGKLLDVGCGIGNSTLPFAKAGFECVGVDISPKMVELAKRYSEKHKAKINFKKGNILDIPLPANRFDYVISIAALHHLDSEEKRLSALEEIKRVLKKKGKVFLTVWNKKTNQRDAYVPWTSKSVKHQRYYHFFNVDELKGLLEKSGFKKVKVFLDGRKKNICALASR